MAAEEEIFAVVTTGSESDLETATTVVFLGAGAIVFLTDGQGDTPPEVVAADVRQQVTWRGLRRFSLDRATVRAEGSASSAQPGKAA